MPVLQLRRYYGLAFGSVYLFVHMTKRLYMGFGSYDSPQRWSQLECESRIIFLVFEHYKGLCIFRDRLLAIKGDNCKYVPI